MPQQKSRLILCPNFPVCAVEPDTPTLVFWITELDDQHGVAFRTNGRMHQFHPCLRRSAPAFLHIACKASADEVLPSGFPAPTSRHHMVDAQLVGGKMVPAILANMSIAGKHIAASQMQFLLGEPVERQQTDDPWNLHLKIDGANPVVAGLLGVSAEFADFPPRFKGIGVEFSLLQVNHLGQFAAQKTEGAADIDDVDGHVETIEHQHAAR